MKILRNGFIFALALIIVCSSNLLAATKYEGMVPYRDGVLLGLQWHTGIFVSPDANYSKPIVHIGGSDYKVTRVPYSASGDDFLDGNCLKEYIINQT